MKNTSFLAVASLLLVAVLFGLSAVFPFVIWLISLIPWAGIGWTFIVLGALGVLTVVGRGAERAAESVAKDYARKVNDYLTR